MESASVDPGQERPLPTALDNAAEAPQRPKFFQKSASFFSRSSAAEGEQAPKLSTAGLSSWARNLKMMATSPKENGQAKEPSKSAFSNFTGGFSKRRIPVVDEETSTSPVPAAQEGGIGSFAKGFLDTSRNAVKVVQTKARHLVSQNKRRYQEGGFDLDMTYITDSIIAMGFPAGDMSSGLFGYMEGFYRNHMEEVIKFFESRHKGKYKVYNLCSERLYDVSLFEGKVASFPFDDHNCPPLHLVMAFCRSAYAWLKDDLENVVVVHCKAGMARTGLMISSLLLYLKFFPTAEECIVNYNERRCFDGKGLILPSQLRYVKYFERVLNDHNGDTPSGRKCILRGIRLHKCPYWIRPSITISDHNGILFSTKKHLRTKDMMPEDFWFMAPRKGIMVFALPGERCVADLNGDFKVHFHDGHGDFYCWLNTNMMESRQMLGTAELDGFDKRRLPSPGFQVEIVILDQTVPPAPQPVAAEAPVVQRPSANEEESNAESRENDDVFSDSESEEGSSVKSRREKRDKSGPASSNVSSSFGAAVPEAADKKKPSEALAAPSSSDKSVDKAAAAGAAAGAAAAAPDGDSSKLVAGSDDAASDYVHVKESAASSKKCDEESSNDFRPIAADASVFTFGDEDDYDSEG